MMDSSDSSLKENKYAELLARARVAAARIEEARNSSIYRSVMGFFVAKGLLTADVKPAPTVKLDVRDVLQIGHEVEPRVLEALPAAITFFPKTFLRVELLPEELKAVLRAIKKGTSVDGMYRGLNLRSMVEHSKAPIRDKRVSLPSKKKSPRTFRFSRVTNERLAELAARRGESCTEVLEALVAEEARSPAVKG